MFNKKRKEKENKLRTEGRLPPGQAVTEKWPVLHYGSVAHINKDEWTLRTFGMVEEEKTWTWTDFLELPTTVVDRDIHCVTGWSKFDMKWEGVLFRDFIELAGLKPDVSHVIAHAEHNGFTTNLPLEAMLGDDVLLAYKADGELLTAEHGAPVRTFVPGKYFWKSAKWLTALEFTNADRLGFWEQAGYHNNADPFKEERYAGRSGFLF